MKLVKETQYTHGNPQSTGIILVNLGTPEKPTTSSVRKYLAEFLSDQRVVEIPRFFWLIILHCFILPFRPRQTAKKYRTIWTEEGSPLRVNTKNLANAIARSLQKTTKSPFIVDYAMRYGKPSFESVIVQQKKKNIKNVLVVPLYPQYSSSTTGSVFDATSRAFQKMRNIPNIRFLRSFHDHAAYIDACAAIIEQFWRENGFPSKLILSFHGVPKFSLLAGDPYHCECHKTARLIAEKLHFDDTKIIPTFQSRFGRAEWLKPYTIDVMKSLGEAQTERVDVFCPGFTSDCLETLEEIKIENKNEFLAAGGKSFNFIPCLNINDNWITGLDQIVRENIEGWISPDYDPGKAALQANKSKERALELGAKI